MPDLFAEKTAAFVSAAESFAAIAQAGDQATISAAFGDVGKTCGGCHDEFREDN
ncbi:MAG: cytochrome c [Pseudomonadota bacterium]